MVLQQVETESTDPSEADSEVWEKPGSRSENSKMTQGIYWGYIEIMEMEITEIILGLY